MANEKKLNLSEEYLRKFSHRIGYVINESPKYYPLVNDEEEFDSIPSLTNEAGDQEDAPKPEGQVPPAPSNDIPQGIKSPKPSFADDEPQADQPITPIDNEEPIADPQRNIPITSPNSQNQVNDIQNEIIKHNVEAMKSIHDQLESLSTSIDTLNNKLSVLNADVEEVREPTNTEKLMNKKDVSYPYYFNLNDFWKNNWFDEKHNEATEKGMKELPDGTYVADFDDLPHQSKIDIQNSFDKIV